MPLGKCFRLHWMYLNCAQCSWGDFILLQQRYPFGHLWFTITYVPVACIKLHCCDPCQKFPGLFAKKFREKAPIDFQVDFQFLVVWYSGRNYGLTQAQFHTVCWNSSLWHNHNEKCWCWNILQSAHVDCKPGEKYETQTVHKQQVT